MCMYLVFIVEITKKYISVLIINLGVFFFSCSRLGLISLAYLWQRDQAELLEEMINNRVNAILVKVATLGLSPTKHLGKTISQLHSHLLNMKEKYGLNVCGEGGEYETFTLDCPLYINTIVMYVYMFYLEYGIYHIHKK